jgi:hypothetical protein
VIILATVKKFFNGFYDASKGSVSNHSVQVKVSAAIFSKTFF